MGKAWAAGLKSFLDHQQSVKYRSATIKTMWPVCAVTSSEDRWIGPYSIGLIILGRLSCLNKKMKKVCSSIVKTLHGIKWTETLWKYFISKNKSYNFIIYYFNNKRSPIGDTFYVVDSSGACTVNIFTVVIVAAS